MPINTTGDNSDTYHSAGKPVEVSIQTQKDNAILSIPGELVYLRQQIGQLTQNIAKQNEVLTILSNTAREIAANHELSSIKYTLQRMEALQRDTLRKIPPETKSWAYHDDIHLLSDKAWDRVYDYLNNRILSVPSDTMRMFIDDLKLAARNGVLYDDD